MPLLLTSLCRVGGEEIHDRLDQSGYSVLPSLSVDPDAVPARGLGCNRPDTGDPALGEKPSRIFSPEGPDEVLDGRARRKRHAVHLAPHDPLCQSIPSFEGRMGLVGGWDDDLGAGLSELFGQDLTGDSGARDEDLHSRERGPCYRFDQGLRPELLRHHVYPQPEVLDLLRGSRTDGGNHRSPRHRPHIEAIMPEPLHESLDAVYASEDQPVEGVEIIDGRVQWRSEEHTSELQSRQ